MIRVAPFPADHVLELALNRHPARLWLMSFAAALALTLLLAAGIVVLLARGVGIWGVDIPVAWGFAITDYVWWIGIGMGGTFISAALYITRQPWRTSLSRYAEAMTVIAVSVSGIFPIFHLGRPWFFYWLMPYPDRMGVWPQWRSSLTWDFFAISAYLIVSALYFYTGLLPDLAALRDAARSRGRQVIYGLLALGWRGEARDWQRHRTLMLFCAAVAVPLVFSVHSMVALDFSVAQVAGWHSTIFPPFFVAGALFSGCAMVLVLGIPMRRALGLDDVLTTAHFEKLSRLMLAIGLIVAYGYAAEVFMAFYGGDAQEMALTRNRFTGAYAWVYWTTIGCNVVALQALWWRRMRSSLPALFVLGVLVLVGMWMERFMLIVTSLYRERLPSSWGMFFPTFWDFAFLFGSIGLFLALFLLFVRYLPVLPMFELRQQAASP
jgi:Ni/Fe-hydrogenase subunit HybB-like protein